LAAASLAPTAAASLEKRSLSRSRPRMTCGGAGQQHAFGRDKALRGGGREALMRLPRQGREASLAALLAGISGQAPALPAPALPAQQSSPQSPAPGCASCSPQPGGAGDQHTHISLCSFSSVTDVHARCCLLLLPPAALRQNTEGCKQRWQEQPCRRTLTRSACLAVLLSACDLALNSLQRG
jgi:hypothetical protein